MGTASGKTSTSVRDDHGESVSSGTGVACARSCPCDALTPAAAYGHDTGAVSEASIRAGKPFAGRAGARTRTRNLAAKASVGYRIAGPEKR
jgi:hypothetical protein